MSQKNIINPKLSHEAEIASWDRYHRAAEEAMAHTPKPARISKLSREAVKALGPVSPELAWIQLVNMVSHAQAEYTSAAEAVMAQNPDLNESLDHLLESLTSKTAFPDPVSTINHLVESNPTMNLQDIDHLPVLQPLKAIVRMLMINDAYL